MWGWLLRRLGQILPTLLILSFMIFGLQQLMPGAQGHQFSLMSCRRIMPSGFGR